MVKKQIDRATTLVESGGDWDRRNRLKAYQGLHLLTVRAYAAAAPLLLDSLSTFTSYELCNYSSLVVYAVLAGSVALKRVDFKAKVVDAPEIKAILGEGEDKLSALSGALSAGPAAGDEEMTDAQTFAQETKAVNLTMLGQSGTGQQDEQVHIDFKPLANLVTSLYNGNYQSFFIALGKVEDNFLGQDRYLCEHRQWYVREMRLRGYQQLLQSYRKVGLESMAKDFGVSVDFLDKYVPAPLVLAVLMSAGTCPTSSRLIECHAQLTASRKSSKPTGLTTRTSSTTMCSGKAISSSRSCRSTDRLSGSVVANVGKAR